MYKDVQQESYIGDQGQEELVDLKSPSDNQWFRNHGTNQKTIEGAGLCLRDEITNVKIGSRTGITNIIKKVEQ